MTSTKDLKKKKALAKKLNALIAKHERELQADISKALKDADMWYNDGPVMYGSRSTSNRNADLFIEGGAIMDADVDDWIHTREEMAAANPERKFRKVKSNANR